MLVRVWRKGNPPTLSVGMKSVQPLWKTTQRILKTQCCHVVQQPRYWHLSGENANSQRYTHPSGHKSTTYNSQDKEAT